MTEQAFNRSVDEMVQQAVAKGERESVGFTLAPATGSRKVVQVVWVQDTDTHQGIFMVLCNDGSMWEHLTEMPIVASNGGASIWGEAQRVWREIAGPQEVERPSAHMRDAAPEMYEALVLVLNDATATWNEFEVLGRAALAKAEGRA